LALRAHPVQLQGTPPLPTSSIRHVRSVYTPTRSFFPFFARQSSLGMIVMNIALIVAIQCAARAICAGGGAISVNAAGDSRKRNSLRRMICLKVLKMPAARRAPISGKPTRNQLLMFTRRAPRMWSGEREVNQATRVGVPTPSFRSG